MDKKHALFFALSISLLLASNYYFFIHNFSPEREKARISRIIDGDTIELEDGRIIRLANINAPEKNIPGSELATNYLKNYENKTIELEILGEDKYNRLLARIYSPRYINLELVKEGFSSKFLVHEGEFKIFNEAENKAIKSSSGIWKKSPYYGCFKSEIHPKNEIVTIINNCNNLNIASWILKDESRKLYNFKNIEIGRVVLHSKEGDDSGSDIFWNSKTEIWNNDRDSVYIFDNNWKIAHFNYYGY